MDQLEIISPTGAVEFFTLDPTKGVINIGRHPDNDLTLNDPQVAPYQLMLDYRQRPYHLMLLSQSGRMVVDGAEPPLHQWLALSALTRLQVGSHTLLLVEDEAISPSPALVPERLRSETRPLPIAPPDTRPEPPQPSPPTVLPAPVLTNGSGAGTLLSSRGSGMGLLRTRPADEPDEVILTEISEQEWTINVDNVITTQVKITNAGELVARFYITVQGLDPEWVELSAPTIRVDKNRAEVVTITISPPRQPSSLAGPHHFAVQITSPQYPGRVSQHGATLTINPYYEFAVGELSPKRQAIPWRRHVGRVLVPITNLGNSPAHFRLEGTDDEHACNYEFDVPGEPVALARQADLHLTPEESITVPISITPHSRRLIGLRRRLYPFTVTTSLVAEQPAARSMLGELRSSPLIGPWLILLMTLVMTILILLLVRPRIYNFMLMEGGQVAAISNGTPVPMQWRASIFTNDLVIDPPIEGLEQPLSARGTVVPQPTGNTTYTLVGNNLLSRFAPAIFPAPTKIIEVRVNAVSPQVTFVAEPNQVVGEGQVTLRWIVEDADKIELFRRVGDNEGLEFIDDFSDRPVNTMVVTPEPGQGRTEYVLQASNIYRPTPTDIPQAVTLVTPTPEIVRFEARPPIINEGEGTTLSWLVDRVQQVILQFPDGAQSTQGPSGDLLVRPLESEQYTLIVPGVEPRNVQVTVIPATATPSPTPEPDAPNIIIFAADNTALIQGKADKDEDEKEVVLEWLVEGTVTNVELNGGPDIGIFSNLAASGELPLNITDNTVFVLTAFNQDKTSSKTLQVEVLEATPTPEPSATPEPTPTPLPIPEFLEFTIITPGSPKVVDRGGTNPRIYEVQIDTEVTFQWRTDNEATKVIFTEPGGGAEVGTVPVGQSQKTITENGTFTVVGENADGKQTAPLAIQVRVVDRPPPDPPFSVIGTETPGENEITWRWNLDPNKSDIIGFRVYRADVPGGSFALLPGADENSLPKGTTIFADSLNPTCGKAYYIVAVYENLEGNLLESPVSTNTWFSTPC